MAEMVELSKQRFSSLFKANMGKSPMEYVREIRLTTAARALLVSNKNINDIAYECGYEDANYFIREFKSALIVNEDINDFMAEIANCDYVLIVLTAGYVKSLNCMREVAYLLQQPDWKYKSMVLVVDETIYSTDRKIEILNYWYLRKKKAEGECTTADLGKIILEEEASILRDICSQLEKFLYGITRRKNPHMIAVVNELVRKKNTPRTDRTEREMSDKERLVKEFIEKHGNVSIKEISEQLNTTAAYTSRILRKMQDKKIIEVVGEGRSKKYIVK